MISFSNNGGHSTLDNLPMLGRLRVCVLRGSVPHLLTTTTFVVSLRLDVDCLGYWHVTHFPHLVYRVITADAGNLMLLSCVVLNESSG